MKYKMHEYALIFPEMPEEDYKELKDDIAKNGLLHPIHLYEEKILDGRHRYKACTELGIEPRFIEYKGTKPLTFVVSGNSIRRHLTQSQKAAIAIDFKPFFAKEAKERMSEGGRSGHVSLPSQSRDVAGKMFGVSGRSVDRAEKLKEEDPELFEEIKQGKKTISEAIKSIKDKKKEERIKQEDIDRKKEVADIDIRKGDFKEVLSDVYDISAIITDPPYPHEFIESFTDLAIFAKEHLKKDGFVAVYSGQYHLPEVIRRLSEHLTYVWTFCLYHVGQKQLVNGVNIMCGWKPVLIFSNGKKKMRFSAYDVLISEHREKSSHKWQQSESGVYPLIDILTRPGELVVDPFAGSGSFLIAAKENGRVAIGAEINN